MVEKQDLFRLIERKLPYRLRTNLDPIAINQFCKQLHQKHRRWRDYSGIISLLVLLALPLQQQKLNVVLLLILELYLVSLFFISHVNVRFGKQISDEIIEEYVKRSTSPPDQRRYPGAV
jgi:hypothetical protein